MTNKNTWTSNTLIKQGARLVAAGEDVGEELPSSVRLELEAEVGVASKPGAQASFLPDPALRPEEAMVHEVLCSDEWLEIDRIPESLETQLISSEVFTAQFELEMAGRMPQLPGEELGVHSLRAESFRIN